MRLALLISGGGTTMEAIIKACKEGVIPNMIPCLVVSSSATAGGITKAHALGIASEDIIVLDPHTFKTRELFGEALIAECKKRNVDIIGQYGWHWKTPYNVITAFQQRIINQHPGPLDTGRPDFGGAGMFGLRVHEARLLFIRKVNRDFWTEATTHYVIADFDKGKVIKRKQIPVFQNDTAETLQARVLPIEHEVQIAALQDFANNTVTEYTRETPLILYNEDSILEECKQEAKKNYPHG